MKVDCGSVAATPLVSGDLVDGPTYVSPSVTASAAAAAFAAPLNTPVQPWEMTASCLSLLAAASAHYPHLVRKLSRSVLLLRLSFKEFDCILQVLKYLPEALRCVDAMVQGVLWHCIHYLRA
jgi:hypothetical protein